MRLTIIFRQIVYLSFFLLSIYLIWKKANKKRYSTTEEHVTYAISSDISKKKIFYVVDVTANSHPFKENPVIDCGNDLKIHWSSSLNDIKQADILSYHLHEIFQYKNVFKKHGKDQFSLIYVMESEANSPFSCFWENADFNMWYNLERSYPAPATYFDIKRYLISLLVSPSVPFSQKREVPIAWAASNCAAYNSREELIRKLMEHISIDSFGSCLKNKDEPDSQDRSKTSKIYSNYKFVICIENSNCEDYITEKLIQVFESGAVPIVAGYDDKPNYLKFVPKNSFINVYSFDTVEKLASHIKAIASNETEYNKLIYFRSTSPSHTQSFKDMSLKELIAHARDVIGDQLMFNELIKKETSENKYCKIAKFLTNLNSSYSKRPVHPRPSAEDVCLPYSHLQSYFKL